MGLTGANPADGSDCPEQAIQGGGSMMPKTVREGFVWGVRWGVVVGLTAGLVSRWRRRDGR